MLKSRIFYFLFTMVVTKLDCKKTDVNCRRSIALTGPDRHRKRVVMGLFQRLAHVHAEFLIVGNDVEARRVKRYIPKSRGFSKNRCFEDFFFPWVSGVTENRPTNPGNVWPAGGLLQLTARRSPGRRSSFSNNSKQLTNLTGHSSLFLMKDLCRSMLESIRFLKQAKSFK